MALILVDIQKQVVSRRHRDKSRWWQVPRARKVIRKSSATNISKDAKQFLAQEKAKLTRGERIDNKRLTEQSASRASILR